MAADVTMAVDVFIVVAGPEAGADGVLEPSQVTLLGVDVFVVVAGHVGHSEHGKASCRRQLVERGRGIALRPTGRGDVRGQVA